MSAATRSESALVRPFAGIHDADAALAKVRLLVGANEYEPGAIVLPATLLSTATLTVRLPERDEIRRQVEKTVVPAVDCGLVVMATGRTHRASAVFVQEYLRTASYESDLVLPRGQADLVINDRAGFSLTVAIVLLNDLAAAPLRPHMAGTWLARRDFRVSPEQDETSFSPEELTDEIREHHRLPKGVLRYVHVDDVLDVEVISDAVHVYVDPEVLNLLLANPTESSAVQMQIELAIQAIETVAQAIVSALREQVNNTAVDSLDAFPAAERFVTNLAGSLDRTVADTIALADEPNVLRALLEAAFDMRNATSMALKER